MFERQELQVLKKRILEQRRFIQVVMGPRQVGKTTMVNQLYKKVRIPGIYEAADAVAAGNSDWIVQIWETARNQIKLKAYKEFLLIIDEIQKITNWNEIIKKLWDEDSRNDIQLKVILLGSSRLLLQEGLTESLTGRFETIYLTHWTYSEMNSAFDWDENKYAWFGGYPGSAGLTQNENRWKSYIRDSIIETSISKDILMLTRIDKPALLKNLFELGCTYSGKILSLNKVQGQLHDAGNTTTLSHYLRLLETAGLLAGLEKYSSTQIRKRSSSPKFQVYNNALLSALQPKHLSETLNIPHEWGHIVESAIGSYLINQSHKENYSVFYWRERNDEVDFILEKQSKTIAIEVKSKVAENKKGLTTFRNKFNPSATYLIDNKNLSWQEFLTINPSELF